MKTPWLTRHALVIAPFVCAVIPRAAYGHFRLTEPACYSAQDTFGSPQKSAPCGQDDPGNPAVPTGAVTVYRTGDTLTLRLNETVFHPGHYRISIAQTQAQLPQDPVVTPGTNTPCGTTVIDPAPTLPVLADGVLQHTAAFSGEQSVQIPLPANFSCDHCVLQITEFMSQHALNNPGGCFYHHCATVSVLAPGVDAGVIDAGNSSNDAGTNADSSTTTDIGLAMDTGRADTSNDAGTTRPPTAGCGCRTTSVTTHTSLVASGLVAWIAIAFGRKRKPQCL